MSKTSTRWTRVTRVAGVVGALAMLTSTVVLPAAHAAPAHATALTLWAPYSGPDRDKFITIINGFNSSQSAIQVNYDQQSETGYGDKVTAALAAGKGPNMWIGDNVQMSSWASQNQLSNLDSIVKGSKVINTKTIDKGAWQGMKYHGHIYSLPLDALPMTMYYNKSNFRKAGLNPNKPPVYSSAKFQATVKKLTKGTSQYGIFIPSAWPIGLLYPSVLYQFGGKLFNVSTKKALFNSKAGVQALTALYNMVWKNHYSPANIGGTDPDMRMVATGQAAIVLDGPWQSQHPSIKAMGANAGIAQFPQFGPKRAVAFYSHYLVTYTKNSAAENKAALKFAEYFNKHSILMAQAGDSPMYKPVLNSKAMKKLPAAGIAAMMKYAIPAGPTFSKFNPDILLNDAVIPAMQGKLKPSGFKAALNSAAAKENAFAQSGS